MHAHYVLQLVLVKESKLDCTMFHVTQNVIKIGSVDLDYICTFTYM